MRNPHIRLASFWRRWWALIALGAAAGALAAYLYGSRATPKYEAEAQVLVTGAPGGNIQGTTGLLPTLAELVRSSSVLAYARRTSGSQASLDELSADVRGESDQATRLITIRAKDTDRVRAVALANGLAEGLQRYVSQAPALPTTGAQPAPRPTVRVVVPASSATRVRPVSSLLLEFGAVAGLFGALAFALVAEVRRPNVIDEEELTEIGGLPVLGSVNGAWARDGTSFLNPVASSLEESAAYRRLATSIVVASHETSPRSIVVAGAEGAEGSWAVGVKLALAFAEEGRRVVFVDFEGNETTRLLRFGKGGHAGKVVKRSEPLTLGETTFDRFTLRSGASVVLAVPRAASPALSLADARGLLSRLSVDADLLLLHAAPPSRSRSALTWAQVAGATVVVVREEETTRASVMKALEGLEPVGPKLLGTVLQKKRP